MATVTTTVCDRCGEAVPEGDSIVDVRMHNPKPKPDSDTGMIYFLADPEMWDLCMQCGTDIHDWLVGNDSDGGVSP